MSSDFRKMILIYPHTLELFKEHFDKINKIHKNSNSLSEWEKIKFNLQNNRNSEDWKRNASVEPTKNLKQKLNPSKDQSSQTYIFKRNQETSCSPIKNEIKNTENIFKSNPINETTPQRRVSAIGSARNLKNRNHNISLLDDSYDDATSLDNRGKNIFKNLDGSTDPLNSDIIKRKRNDVTIYMDDDLRDKSDSKKLKDDYRVMEKDGVVYTVVGDPEDIHDNGDLHDIVEISDKHYKQKNKPQDERSPIGTRSTSKLKWANLK